MNIEELKQKLVDHMSEMDLSDMSVKELRTYADTVRIVNDLFKPDVLAEALKAMTDRNFANPYPMDRGLAGIQFEDTVKT